MTNQELARTYEPGRIERKWYEFWLSRGYFTPPIDPEREPFVITMPPPNVTGELHVGHALTMTIEDVLIRWHRMLGDASLWVPGTDHSGIAVQVLVEKDLALEGKTREGVGREEFLRRAWERATKSRAAIREQLEMLGASCDWTRDAFTLDDGPSRAVRTAFVRLYDKGLIYRGERMVNWCPRCQTALSDLEVEHKEIQGALYYFRYPTTDGTRRITIATTRPETCYGDTAVAVNPSDERYASLIGTNVVLPVSGREIPVIADEAVDPAFGTGALKITPCHDPTDLEIADRHGLPHVDVLTDTGTMNEYAIGCVGLTREACRDRVIDKFDSEGLLEKTEPHVHTVGHCGRCGVPVEPRISRQWFVQAGPLAAAAIEAVRNGEIRIVPDNFTRVYFSWMESIKDWCISRQLWWGHRIPVWYCLDCGEVFARVEDPDVCASCGSTNIEQDPDVLDTWFSSGLWPHSTLGWPDDTEDMRYFYPTTVMQTGYDILFFWVARMIMMGIEDTGKIPFRVVYLNGLIRDEHGQKMSKMRGNVIRPDDAIGKYGVDALRFALTTGNSPGNDLSLGTGKLEASRNFVNKLWNAARFVLSAAAHDPEAAAKATAHPETLEDRWIMSRLTRVIAEANELMHEFQPGEAERQIHDFVWSEYCDWYIEMAKLRLREDGPSPVPYLVAVMEASLRMLHPFMPFVTEELWQKLKPFSAFAEGPDSIIIAPYPSACDSLVDPRSERVLENVIDVVRTLRNARAESGVAADRWAEAQLYADDALDELKSMVPFIQVLARTKISGVEPRAARPLSEGEARAIVLTDVDVVLAAPSSEDLGRLRQQLMREAETSRARLEGIEARLQDELFISRAPAAVVEKQKKLATELREKLARIEAELGGLG
ncbi:MAG: valine--tRNA ligase [Chloroflexota bacterium]